MYVITLDNVDLGETWWSEQDPQLRHRGVFVTLPGLGATQSAAILAELDPGYAVGRHTDSAEETILILKGTLEASIGPEHRLVKAGDLVVVPAMLPHNFRNIGTEPAQFLGLFASGQIVSTFEVPLMPARQ